MQVPADSLRAVLDSVFRAPKYTWREETEAFAMVARWWRALIGWIAGLREANPLGYRLFVAAIVLVLVAVLAHAAWVLVRTIRGAREAADSTAAPTGALRRDGAWYLRSADLLAAEGRFAEALQNAFVGLAFTLDGRGLLTYHPSRTPAEVARDARVRAEDHERLTTLVRTLYASAFGGVPCGADDYRAWRELAGREWHAAAH